VENVIPVDVEQVSLGTRIVRGTAGGFLFTVLSNGFLFVGHLLIPRILTRAEYAQFTVSISFVAMIALIADLGMNALITRLLAEAEEAARSGQQDRRGSILGSALALRGIMSIVVVAIVLTIAPLLYTGQMVTTMTILLLTLLISSRIIAIRAIADCALRSRSKFYLSALFALIDAITFSIVLFYGQYHALGITSIVWIYTLCNVPGFCISVIAMARWIRKEHIKLHVNLKSVRAMLRLSLPFSLCTAFVTVHAQIDSLLLDKLSTAIEVSSYGATIRLFSAVIPVATVLGSITAPEITKLLHRRDDERSRRLVDLSLRFLLVTGAGVALILAVVSNSLMLLLLGPKYASSATLFAWSGWLLVPIFITTFLIESSAAAGKFWFPTIFAVIAMVSVVIGDLLLIPSLGASGAMLSKFVAVSLGGVVLVWLSRNSSYLDVRKFINSIARLIAVSSMGLLLAWALKMGNSNTALSGFLIVIVFLTSVHFTRLLSLQEAFTLVKRFRNQS
jgi:O-antigen/teichoic acid export membrane protein